MKDDLISRQAAIEALREKVFHNLSDEFYGAMQVLDELPSAQQWIPVTSRPMDEEERLEWSKKTDFEIEDSEAIIYTSQLPDDGEEVLTCDRYGNVRIDIFENDLDYGCYFEENGDMDGIIAWMPLPEPYKAGEEGET